MRVKEVLTEDIRVTLGQLCDIRTNFEDADFWIVRRGSEETVGKPTKEFNPEHIGIRVKVADVLDPQYLYYVFMHLHMQGHFKKIARGTLKLVSIRTEDIRNIPLTIPTNESLNEAKFSKDKIYAYHGTHSGNLRSIIKKGLVAQHNAGWGSGKASSHGYDLTALGGVYFGLDYESVYKIAKDVVGENKKNGNASPIIVVATIQPKSIVMDEDRIQDILDVPDAEALLAEISDGIYLKPEDYINSKMMDIERLIYDPDIEISDPHRDHLKEMIKRYYSEYLSDLFNLAELNYAEDIEDDDENNSDHYTLNMAFPDREEILRHIKYDQMRLRKLMSNLWQQLIYDRYITEESDALFAIENDVGFSGSNKIVGIIHPEKKMYWGDTGNLDADSTGPDLEGYTRVSTPMELLRDD